MDMLYRAYSCPMDLMRVCINQGRFGAFVEGFLRAESDRRKAETEREQDFMLWIAYVHSGSGDTFNAWKEKICTSGSTDVYKRQH